MIKVDIELEGQIHTISLNDIEDEKSAIEYVWSVYGFATPILNIYRTETSHGEDSAG